MKKNVKKNFNYVYCLVMISSGAFSVPTVKEMLAEGHKTLQEIEKIIQGFNPFLKILEDISHDISNLDVSVKRAQQSLQHFEENITEMTKFPLFLQGVQALRQQYQEKMNDLGMISEIREMISNRREKVPVKSIFQFFSEHQELADNFCKEEIQKQVKKIKEMLDQSKDIEHRILAKHSELVKKIEKYQKYVNKLQDCSRKVPQTQEWLQKLIQSESTRLMSDKLRGAQQRVVNYNAEECPQIKDEANRKAQQSLSAIRNRINDQGEWYGLSSLYSHVQLNRPRVFSQLRKYSNLRAENRVQNIINQLEDMNSQEGNSTPINLTRRQRAHLNVRQQSNRIVRALLFDIQKTLVENQAQDAPHTHVEPALILPIVPQQKDPNYADTLLREFIKENFSSYFPTETAQGGSAPPQTTETSVNTLRNLVRKYPGLEIPLEEKVKQILRKNAFEPKNIEEIIQSGFQAQNLNDSNRQKHNAHSEQQKDLF
ncbi:hypothetical protein [Holospora curviuscula]|uniref:Uncharacterized protein n=1 Tax=Holospora curviuscula TaxID=1082868 RepID=A0A2S5R982_9PROT|nr:hypothetical protein [Holospora curviuscula]PPE03685.1 hypothetical protein HCUR_00915 [Holospora curviuscula]